VNHARAGAVHTAFGALATALCVLYATTVGPAHNLAVLLASLVPAVVVVGMLVRDPGSGVAWWAVLGGLTALTVVNTGALVAEGIRGLPSWDSPAALAFQSIGYLGLLVGCALVTLPRSRRLGHGAIDAAIIGIGTASAVWAGLLGPGMRAHGASVTSQLLVLITVVLISAIVGTVVRAAALTRDAREPVAYLLLATVATWVGTVAGGLTADPETGAEAPWIRYCWIVGYLALAAALAHPAFGRIALARATDPGRLTGRRLVLLGLALTINPLIAAATLLVGRRSDAILLSIGTLALVPLVLARIDGLARLHAEALARLTRLATLDELTGLPHRRGVTQRLEAAVGRLRTGDSSGLVVIFLDLDGFKEINDSHGHHTGDQLLVAVSHRLRRSVRAADVVGRFGGDEFVILLEGDPAVVQDAVVATVGQVLAEPVHLADLVTRVTASVGAASALPGDHITAEELLRAADAAMYRRKREREAEREPSALP